MIGRKVALSSALLGGGQIIAKGLDTIALVVVARFLTPADFGLVALASAVLLIANAVTDLPVSDVLVQRKDLNPRDLDAAFTLTLARGLFIALALLVLSAPVAAFYHDPRLVPILCVLAIAPAASGLSSPMMVRYSRDVNYVPLAAMQIVGKVAAFVASVAVAYATRSYWAIVAGLVAAPVLPMLMTHILAPWRPRLSFKGARSIVQFAGWVTFSRMIVTLNQQADRFFVGGILGKTQLGYYSLGSDVASTATYALAGPVTQPLFAGFARIHDDHERLASAYLKGQQMMMAFVLPAGAGLACLAAPVVTVLLGARWAPVVPVIQWLAPVIALQMLTVPIHAASMALGRPQVLALRETLALVLRLPATLVAAAWFGIEGAVIARALSGLVIIWVNLHIARSLVGPSVMQQIRNCGRSLGALAAMTGGLLAIQAVAPAPTAHWPLVAWLAAMVAAGGALYIGAHLVLWSLTGRPSGPERLVLDASTKLIPALQRARSA